MLEKALKGSKIYWGWLLLLGGVIGVGFLCYLYQYFNGLGITGLSRDVTWGLYISQLTYLVGVAASAVMVVLPYYLHNYKAFGKLTVLGEFLAVSAVLMCMLFVFVDMGMPFRVINIIIHPTPNSIMFWDFTVLTGYLLLNITIAWTSLAAEKKGLPPPHWVKPLIYISIPWAVSIHTVTAFLYSGLPGRHFWLTAIMAARFLSSAFCSGPAVLLVLIFIVRKFTSFDAGKEAIQKLAQIITYAIIINVFFFLLEVFTAFYSQIPGHKISFIYLFVGLEGKSKLVPWMWTSIALAVISIILLVVPKTRHNEKILGLAAITVIASTWIDKGLGLVVGGFVPSPLEHVTEYWPTLPELAITLGIYAIGATVITVLYKIAVTVKEEALL